MSGMVKNCRTPIGFGTLSKVGHYLTPAVFRPFHVWVPSAAFCAKGIKVMDRTPAVIPGAAPPGAGIYYIFETPEPLALHEEALAPWQEIV